MRKIKGFRIGRQVSTWILRNTRIRRSGYNRVHSTRQACTLRPIAKLKSWGQRLKQSFRLFGSTRGSGCIPVDHTKPDPVPRGHLAIYVGQKDSDCHRVLVPIVYFNHPLFGELLRETEKVRILPRRRYYYSLSIFRLRTGQDPNSIRVKFSDISMEPSFPQLKTIMKKFLGFSTFFFSR